MTLQVVTANRLRDGEVVFLGTRGWVLDIARATVAQAADEVKALEALARQSEAVNEVVDAYLVEVERRDDGLRPVKLREYLRTLGPSVRTDLGKQAMGARHVPL